MDPAVNPNGPGPGAGLAGLARALGALGVLVAAMIGVLVVLDVIPAEALQQWLTKTALVLVIVAAAAVAIWALVRAGSKGP